MRGWPWTAWSRIVKSERKAAQLTPFFFFLGVEAATSVIISLNLHLNVASFNHDFVRADGIKSRRRQGLAGLEVEVSSVPGASDLQIAYLAFTKWAAAVGAGVVKGVILPGDVEDRNAQALDIECRRFAGR